MGITVKEFFKKNNGIFITNCTLYEINEEVELRTNSDEMSSDDELHEEWKNAEIVGWSFYNDELVLTVEK